jgi:hypothetical protein
MTADIEPTATNNDATNNFLVCTLIDVIPTALAPA